ncbi:hypothetical protein [Streptomyces sp. PU-14G]|uniref:hypothetical protein n=1 Tax=Streptomyces sp. PU-14G TaxID=2800808 RepID=UPI0034DF01D8
MTSLARFLAGLALTLVVVAMVLLFLPVKAEGATDDDPSCGPLVAPEAPHLDTVECNTRHVRQLGHVAMMVTGALGCAVVSFMLRIEQRAGAHTDGRSPVQGHDGMSRRESPGVTTGTDSPHPAQE